jgi:ABC-type Fe3+-hydroxamate transport system, periplasmic component
MKKVILNIFTVLFLLSLTGCAANQAAESDAPKIIVTCPEIIPILDRLGVDGVVGIVETNELPDRFKAVAQIGSAKDLDLAAIEDLKPTLILGSNRHEEQQAPLFIERDIDSAFINLATTTEMMQSIRDLGPLIDQEEQSDKWVAEFQEFIQTYRNEVLDNERPSVLILVGDQDGYHVANETSPMGNLLKLAGGLNVLGSEYGDIYVAASEEAIKEANPDIILRVPISMDDSIAVMFEQEFSHNEMWHNLDAVTNESVYDLPYQVFGTSLQLDYQVAIVQLRGILYPLTNTNVE